MSQPHEITRRSFRRSSTPNPPTNKNDCQTTFQQEAKCVISVFRHGADENCALRGYHAASSGNFLPTFMNPIGPIFKGQGLRIKKWDRQVVPKCRQEITTARCVMTHKRAHLSKQNVTALHPTQSAVPHNRPTPQTMGNIPLSRCSHFT